MKEIYFNEDVKQNELISKKYKKQIKLRTYLFHPPQILGAF